ncbi:hypothetical protein [Kribbella sp. DT2]|uniref:hypothetical protein n=1 Tax=Kribbella sp. DT2 TaxID=3393427 RepID=UPI003CFAFA59
MDTFRIYFTAAEHGEERFIEVKAVTPAQALAGFYRAWRKTDRPDPASVECKRMTQ